MRDLSGSMIHRRRWGSRSSVENNETKRIYGFVAENALASLRANPTLE